MKINTPIPEKGRGGGREQLIAALAFALLAVCFVLLASDTTSPLFATVPYRIVSADSPTFIVIGRYWLTEGALPYTELFDQKGPIPFLLNGLGWLLSGSANGICVVQSLFLFACLLLLYRSCRERFSPRGAVGILAFFFLELVLLYGLGNTVEEYNLPVMALCLWGFVRYLHGLYEQGRVEHAPGWAFVYGLGMAFFLLNRPSDAAPVGIGVLCIGIGLLRRGAGRNLGQNLLAGLAGLAALILPFVLYFAAHGALADFWYGAIGFNLVYAANDTAFWLTETTWKSAVKLGFYCLPLLGSLVTALLAARKKQWLRTALWAGIGVYGLLFYTLSRGYPHYLITFLPLTAAVACEGRDLLADAGEPLRRGLRRAGLCLLAVTLLLALVQERKYFSDSDFRWKELPRYDYDVLIEQIPAEDRDQVLLLNCLSSVYLRHDIRPCCRYFSFQDWQARFSQDMMDRMAAEFSQGKARWILASGPAEAPLQRVLEEGYTPVAREGNYVLYERKQEKF